ncbi:RDD family protein [Sulfitobacter sp. HNIBRBA3233]|uniref:RDD family protein n=1 Tax=Sulfitobacter marinivivus TaxID=3158558 RepID=UPI0032DE37FE
MTPDPEQHPDFYDGVPLKRLLAWVVDVIVTALLTAIAVLLTALTGLFILPVLYLLLGFAYRMVTLARGSATWGMWLMGIELRTHDDRRFDVAHAGLHTLGYSLSVAMPLAQLASIVMMLSTERRQGLTDLVMGTVALNRRR